MEGIKWASATGLGSVLSFCFYNYLKKTPSEFRGSDIPLEIIENAYLGFSIFFALAAIASIAPVAVKGVKSFFPARPRRLPII